MKSFLQFCFAACCLACIGQAQAAIYTLRTTGTFYQGFDSQGYFGGGDLTGRSVDWTQLFDTSGSSQLDVSSSSLLRGSAAFGSLSVGGIPLTDVPIGGHYDLYLSNGVTSGGPGPNDELSGFTFANYSGSDVTFVGYSSVYSSVNSFVPSRDFSQTLTRHPMTGDAKTGVVQWNKNVGGVNIGTYGYFTIDTITYNGVTAVPEPETYAMLLAGLGFIGVMARRRNRKAAA